jgi:hypothetical protein
MAQDTALSAPVLYRSFRDFWRGFTDAELEQETIRAKEDIDNIRRDLSSHEKFTRSELNKAERRGLGSHGRAGGYRKTIATLESITTNLDRISAVEVAERRLWRSSDLAMPWSNLVSDMDPLEAIRFKLEVHSPLQVSMPLRFLINEPINLWCELNAAWARNAPRAKLLGIVEKHISMDMAFAEIRSLHDALAAKGLPDRSAGIDELGLTWNAGAFMACTLIAVTQAEGIIWDLARLLNSRGILIFRETIDEKGHPVRNAYSWNAIASDYERNEKGDIKHINQKLNSARMLLSQTRLGGMLSREMYSYLIDEYYDDRNHLAHGATVGRSFRDDALAAMLCIKAVYQEAVQAISRP